MLKIIEKKIIAEFKDRESFSREEFFRFYQLNEPDLKENTFRWRIYNLKNKNIIKTLMRGRYFISTKSKYVPKVSQRIHKISKKINKHFEDAKYCIWETNWLNEFSQHQSNKNITFIEIEKDLMESIYYELKNDFKTNIFLSPDEKTINLYVSESDQAIIVKKLITRSPVQKHSKQKNNFSTPLLEKILVDLFAEKKLFYFSQGSELVHIYENALKTYAINFTKLFNYAKRREKEDDIKKFLNNNMLHLLKGILDD